MSKSGNPEKQQRPDGRDQSDEVVKAFPPAFSCVVTAVETSVVPFAFPGGKGIDLCLHSGPLKLHCHFPPQTAEVVIEAIQQAKMKAETGLEIASQMPNGNGGH